jgi:hypothetical protein
MDILTQLAPHSCNHTDTTHHAIIVVITIAAVGKPIRVLVPVVEQLPPLPLQISAVGVTVLPSEHGHCHRERSRTSKHMEAWSVSVLQDAVQADTWYSSKLATNRRHSEVDRLVHVGLLALRWSGPMPPPYRTLRCVADGS